MTVRDDVQSKNDKNVQSKAELVEIKLATKTEDQLAEATNCSCHATPAAGAVYRQVDESELFDRLSLDRDEFDAVMPMTPMQRDLYLDSLVNPSSLHNSLGYAVEIHSEIEVETWRTSLQRFSDSQSILRCQVITSDEPGLDIAYLGVAHNHRINFEFTDFSAQTITEYEIEELVHSRIYRPYDVNNEPLVNYYLFRIATDRHIIILATHHIVMDGIGFASQLMNVCAEYESQINNTISPRGWDDLFPEYTKYCLEHFDTPELVSFWREMLRYVESLDFQPVHSEPARQPGKVEKTVTLSDDHWRSIQRYCRKNRITPAIYFKCLYGILLERYCLPENDFVISELVAGRPKGHSAAVGCYFQQVPFVVPGDLVKGESSLSDLFGYARDYQRSLKENRNISISLQNQLIPHGKLGFMYNFIHFFPKLTFLGKEEEILQNMNDVEGQVQFVPKVINGQLHLHLIYYDTDFHDNGFLDRVAFLSEQIQAGESVIDSLELMPEAEKAGLLNLSESTTVRFPEVAGVHHLFEQQVQLMPDEIAVVSHHRTITYRELDGRANQLAHFLRDSGVGVGSRVGVLMDRSIEMVIALYGIMKSGAAYVPLDPQHPQDRIDYILDDANIRVLMTQTPLLSRVHSDKIDTFLCLDRQMNLIESYPRYSPNVRVEPEQLINIMYTSGSTGQPKGVMVTHAGIVNRIQWMQAEYELKASDRVLQKTPYTFDVSVWEFFWPLMAGARLVMAKPGGHKDPEYLTEVINQHEITTIHFVPSMLGLFLQHGNASQCRYLRRVICSGEALPVESQQRFFDQLPNVELHNLYGPTEASIDVTNWKCSHEADARSVPIGKAIANTRLYIVDERLNLLPAGVPGELCISGICLAQGYLNREQQTRESFVDNPFSQEPDYRRLYRTGDLAYMDMNGVVHFLGRRDFQVKIRGLRIELGEIEIALKQYPGIEEAVVLAREEGSHDVRLLAYVLVEEGCQVAASELRSRLKRQLPDYMVPSAYLMLDEMPLTANGKLDRKALLNRDAPLAREREFVTPQSPTQKELARLWGDVLNVKDVGLYDNFFEMGGHSLLATQLVSRIRNQFDVEISLPTLFELSSLNEMASYLDTTLKVRDDARSKRPEKQGGRVELEI